MNILQVTVNSLTCINKKFDNAGKWLFPDSQTITSPESDCREIIPSPMTTTTHLCADRCQAQTQAYKENCQRYRLYHTHHCSLLMFVDSLFKKREHIKLTSKQIQSSKKVLTGHIWDCMGVFFIRIWIHNLTIITTLLLQAKGLKHTQCMGHVSVSWEWDKRTTIRVDSLSVTISLLNVHPLPHNNNIIWNIQTEENC